MKMLLPLLRLISRLPLGVLYVLADLCFPLLYYVARYRRKVVTENLNNAFPELSPRERHKIRRRFYRWFCDYVVETLKLLSMSRQEMMRRMIIEGVDEMERSLETKPFVFIFLGHYCNWEWVSSIPLWYQKEDSHGAQLYRPLKNKAFDGLFLEMRSRFGSENISKYEALRHILQLRRDGKKTCIGFISDQTPGWNSIHDWVDFLHQDTPVFTGTERIAKKVDAAIFFADIRRVRRGYYHLVLRRMTDEPKDFPDYALTEQYMRELEQIIRRQPHLWLWSHRRWKHRRAADGSRLDN
ncbi:MAG: lysophospholipid acyltransferase family protein [Alloprevotella sp.]|nr:lysophospholipid acyltransferase family protein [Alloprevotella sp.]MDY2778785.1 lysophospholipid acyltransferase family protein [Alloprevotella sp.]MDY4567581.1 lysophospholipid acyltransferase family protein [Alloprevotella sp.]